MRRDFPGGPVAKTVLPLQGVRFQHLVYETKIPHAAQCSQNKAYEVITVITHFIDEKTEALKVMSLPEGHSPSIRVRV